MDNLTDDKPKGMVRVAGEPLLSHVFRTLQDIGVEELVVVVGYKSSHIIEFYGENFEGIPIQYVHQRVRNGLATAVLQAAPYLQDDFVVLNGDNVFIDDLRALVRNGLDSAAEASVIVEETTVEEARTTGVIKTKDGQVTGLVEKTDTPPSKIITTGCYVLGVAIFDAIRLLRPSENEEYDLSEAVNLLVKAGAHVEALSFTGRRINVNTPKDIELAERILSE